MNNENTKQQQSTKTTYKHFFRKPYYNYRKPFVKHYQNTNVKLEAEPKLEPKANQLQNILSIKRSKSNDNLNNQNNNIDVEALINSIKTFVDNKFKDTSESISTKLRNSINAQVENRCKYYIDQRIGLMLNSDDLLTRGSNSFTISPDASHGAKSFYFNYMHEPVAYFTYDGRLFCKGLFLNGVNILQTISKIMDDESSIAEALSNYVKHIELKNGTYEMDIKSAIVKYLKVAPDDNNLLEFLHDINTAMLINTDRTIGIAMFNPGMSNDSNIYGLKFGKDDTTGVQLLYTYTTNTANQHLSMGTIGNDDTLSIYNDRRIIVNTTPHNGLMMHYKYSGSLDNNNFMRLGIGDDNDTALLAYCRDNNTNYMYLKLYARAAELEIYNDHTVFENHTYVQINNINTTGGILYMKMNSIAVDGLATLYIGKTDSNNAEASFSYKHSTSNPLGCLGFYGNEGLITYDKNGNLNIAGLTASGSISCVGLTTSGSISCNNLTASGSISCVGLTASSLISCNGIYSSDYAIFDGSVLCTQLDIANTTKNTWYLKMRVEDYLSNGNYIRMILKDLAGQANIDLTHDTQYYGLRLQIPTANDNNYNLTVWPTGVTINGALDAYNNVTVWQNLWCKNLTVDDTSVDVPHIAYTNVSNTFTQAQNISVNLDTYWNRPLQILDSTLTGSDHGVGILFGKAEGSTNNIGELDFKYDGNGSLNNYVRIGLCNAESMRCYPNRIIIQQPTTAPKYETTTSNPNTCIGSNFQEAIKKLTGDGIMHDMKPAYTDYGFGTSLYTQCCIMPSGYVSANEQPGCYSDELGLYIILTTGTNSMKYSADGITWLGLTMNVASYNWTKVIWTGLVFVAIASNWNYVIYSSDAGIWATSSADVLVQSNYSWNSIAYSPTLDKYVAVNTSNGIIRVGSNMSVQWDSIDTGAASLYDIVWSDKFGFVGVGYGCYIRSTDGVNWILANMPHTTANYKHLAYGKNNRNASGYGFLAGGDNGLYDWSEDAQTWQIGSIAGFTGNCQDIVYGDERWFVIESGNSTMKTSKNWAFWRNINNHFTTVSTLLYGGGQLIITRNEYYHTYYGKWYTDRTYVTLNQTLQMAYPVGSIYTSMSDVHPVHLFGFGTWIPIQNQFLYCVPVGSNSGQTGGSSTHTIAIDEMPDHTHLCAHVNNEIRPIGTGLNWCCQLSEAIGSTNGYNTSTTGVYGHSGTQSAISMMPPYITVYAWYRSA